MRASGYKVIAPDVVRVFGSQADAGAVIQPQPASLGLFLRHFLALPTARFAPRARG